MAASGRNDGNRKQQAAKQLRHRTVLEECEYGGSSMRERVQAHSFAASTKGSSVFTLPAESRARAAWWSACLESEPVVAQEA
jgi:hypothetical protein